MRERLLAEAARQDPQRQDAALASRFGHKKKSSKSQGGGKNRFRGKCHKCGIVGHMKKDCRSSSQKIPAKQDGEQRLVATTPEIGRGTEFAFEVKSNSSV